MWFITVISPCPFLLLLMALRSVDSLCITVVFRKPAKMSVYSIISQFTPGNVVRGNQNYANEILTGASGHELQSVDRMSTNLLSRYLQISKR